MTAKPNKRLSAKHEKFAQGIADGMTGTDAYLWAGYKVPPSNARAAASRLLAKANIRERVDEILAQRKEIEAEANRIAAEKLSISKEWVLEQLRKIAGAEVRNIVDWHGHMVEEEDNPEGGDVAVIKRTYSNQVSLISADKIDDDTHGAIAEVSQTPTGGLKVKVHDKRAALMDIAKLMGYVSTPGDSPQNPLHIARIERVVIDPPNPNT